MKFIKRLRLRFWCGLTGMMCTRYYNNNPSEKQLKRWVYCHKKECKAFKDLYGYDALEEN